MIGRIRAAREEYHRVNAEYAAGRCDILGRPTAKAYAEDKEARAKWKADKEARLKKKGERTEEVEAGKRRVRRVVHRYESRIGSSHKSGGGRKEHGGLDEVGRAWEERIRKTNGSGRGRGSIGSETFISDHYEHILDEEEGVQDRREGEAEHREGQQEAHRNGNLPDHHRGPGSARGGEDGEHRRSVAAGAGEGGKMRSKRAKPDFLAKVTKRLRKRMRPKQIQKMDAVLEEDEGSMKNEKVREVGKKVKDRLPEVLEKRERDSGGNRMNESENYEKKDDGGCEESREARDVDKMEKGQVDHHGDGDWNQAKITGTPSQPRDEDVESRGTGNISTPVQTSNEDEGGAYKESNNPPNQPDPELHCENSPYPIDPSISYQPTTSRTQLSEEHNPFTDPELTIPSTETAEDDNTDDSDSSTDQDEILSLRAVDIRIAQTV